MSNNLFNLAALFFSALSCITFAQDFKSTYAQWSSKDNSFVNYIDQYDQARVIFAGSAVTSHDNDGQSPTVSEGMGYGLLLAYANNDQILFDKFLRYVLGTAGNYGCSSYDPNKNTCYASSPFLMPWIVNKDGKPFNKVDDPKNPGVYHYSNGSATDADIQIAWAVSLAAS